MRLDMPLGKLTDSSSVRKLFALCWFAYVVTYLGRLNYNACLVEIVSSEGWSKGEAGLIATGFFATYGLGQLLNGFTGDKLSPKLMVGIGLGVSALVNLLFPFMNNYLLITVLWCFNGFSQSMIWSPMVRLISEWLSQERRMKACVNMTSTTPVGTLAVYGISAGLVFLGNWRMVFYTCGTIMLVITVVWFLGISSLEKKIQTDPAEPEAPQPDQTTATAPRTDLRHTPFLKLAFLSAIPFIALGILMQGMLKDGVTTWIPTFLEEQFHMATAGAILCTTVVPIVNLGGVYLAAWMNRRFFKNELLCAGFFFLCGILSLTGLITISSGSALFSLLLLAFTTTFMMGVNMLLVGLVPPYYVHHGVTSTVTGILNSSAYVGCALSSYLNGAIVDRFGWQFIMVCWLCYAIFGLAMCLLACRKWKAFRTTSIAMSDR